MLVRYTRQLYLFVVTMETIALQTDFGFYIQYFIFVDFNI